MRRFLIFPPLIAIWFLAAQIELTVVSRSGTWLAFQQTFSSGLATDVYVVSSPFRVPSFFPAILAGAITGCVFAALDFAFHRDVGGVRPTAIYLTQNLLKGGAIALALILLCQGALLAIAVQQTHRRYHAYPPDITLLNVLYFLQPLLFLASVLWAMGKTLRRRVD